MRLVPGQHIHLVGIGGFGLSAIARVLLEQGYYISGSDRSANALTDALEKEGAVIYKGHDAQNVMGAEMVIASSAVASDHVELAMARALGIPVYKRSDVMASIMSGNIAIAVAGTHGKTTTSAMIAHILMEAGQSPSYIIGGILRNNGRNAGVGSGKAFVIEADEYDNMFHGLRPQIAIVTNVEFDHPDFFATPSEMTQSFSKFIGLLPEDGLLITCADDQTTAILGQNRLVSGLPVAMYGIDSPMATWRATNVHEDGKGQTVFEVINDGHSLGEFRLLIPGRHNVQNALAALIASETQGVPFEVAAQVLANFQGAGRRYDLRGEIGSVTVIDDYAHHPTAIRVTLEATRQRYPNHAIWAVWQPHTYSRTQALLDSYLTAFESADHVLITDIYAAREEPIPGVSAAEVIKAMKHADMRYTPGLRDATRALLADVQAPAVIVIMSAGDAPLIGVEFLKMRRGKGDKQTTIAPGIA
jgi:UDP-N-acetylmuramate--alanine ligase